MNTLGSVIRMVRTGHSLTQTEVAEKTDLSVAYISQLENDKRNPAISTVIEIFNALNFSLVIAFYLMNTQDERIKHDLQEKLAYAAVQELNKESE